MTPVGLFITSELEKTTLVVLSMYVHPEGAAEGEMLGLVEALAEGIAIAG